VNYAENKQKDWAELYEAKAAELVLYGRALGLSHAEAEDVLQETFICLMKRGEPPLMPEHYCVRSFRNRALNYRRSLWLVRALCFRSASRTRGDALPGQAPARTTRNHRPENLASAYVRGDRAIAYYLAKHRRRTLSLRTAKTEEIFERTGI